MPCADSFVAEAMWPLTSDNGMNLRGGERELKEEIMKWNNSVKGWLKQRNISRCFNPPTASHFGGIFKREIRAVRKVLTSVLTEQNLRLTDENFVTLLCEVEAILNNRPLSEASGDPNDCDALTPNNLLLLNSGITFPPGLFRKEDCYLKRRWRQVQYLVNLFWTRWRLEYLSLLQFRQKWCAPKRSLHCNDLVLVVDQQLPRNQWPLGRIVKVFPDRRGVVRSAMVKLSRAKYCHSEMGTIQMHRPITKLVLLRHAGQY